MNASPYLEHPAVDPAYLQPDPERADIFIAAEAKHLAEAMHARLARNSPDQYAVAQVFANSSNAAFYRLMQLAEVGNADALLLAVKKLADEAIDQQADHLATQAWQRIDV